MEALGSQELNWGRDMLICTRNFGFGCNLGGKKKSAYERACLVGGVVSLGGEPR